MLRWFILNTSNFSLTKQSYSILIVAQCCKLKKNHLLLRIRNILYDPFQYHDLVTFQYSLMHRLITQHNLSPGFLDLLQIL